MTWKLLHEEGGQKTFILVFATGDKVVSELEAFARDRRLSAAHFTAIGAFSEATLGYFAWARKDYERIPVEEQVEVLTLAGDIALGEDGTPQVHAHVVLGRRNGDACGGHLLEAHVRPTLEVVLVESPAHLEKRMDPETGLALISPQAG